MGRPARNIEFLLLFLIAGVVFSWPGFSGDDSPRVLALITSRAGPYLEHLEGFKSRFQGEVTSIFMDGDTSELEGRLASQPHSLVFAVGSSAAEFAALHADGGPVFFSMVYYPERHALTGRKNVSGISLRVPPEEVLKALDAVKPSGLKSPRIGAVYPAEGEGPELESIRDALSRSGYVFVLRRLGPGEEPGAVFKSLLPEIDVLWLVPDPAVIPGPDFLKSVLEEALDRKVAVVGMSEAHVRSGALLAVSVDYRLEGEEAARVAGRILEGEDVAGIGILPPRSLVWSLNTRVAKELGWPVLRSTRQRFERVYP